MGQFKTAMQAEVRVPQEGFTQEELKQHLKDTKIPANAKLRPAIVKVVNPSDAYDSQFHPDQPVPEETEVAFIAEWSA